MPKFVSYLITPQRASIPPLLHLPFPARCLDRIVTSMAREGNQTAQQLLGSMFFGTAISFILHGITSCQTIWYFRTQSGRSSKSMMAFITFTWLGETLNCVFMFLATMYAILLPAMPSNPCGNWTGPTQAVASAICTFSAEGFFIMRVWRLSEHKRLTTLMVIPPYIAGYVFGVAQIVRSYRVLCEPSVPDLNPVFVFGTFGCRLVGDTVIAITLCYMLHRRSSGITRHTNTIKIVRGLILWSISTGLLTWCTSVLFLASYIGNLPAGFAVYYIRGGLYVNAMLAQLNARTRFQAMAEESIPLSTINLGETSSQSAARESQPPDRAA